MKYDPIKRDPPETLASDFALIGKAIADAFRGLSSPSRLESRWSQLRSCGCTTF